MGASAGGPDGAGLSSPQKLPVGPVPPSLALIPSADSRCLNPPRQHFLSTEEVLGADLISCTPSTGQSDLQGSNPGSASYNL